MTENRVSEKVYVIGSGAIGGLVGGYLTKKFGKENISLVDINKEHIKAIRDKGLRIYDKGQKNHQLETIDVNIITPDKINKENLENVILATKSYDNDSSLKGLRSDVQMLVLQNGYDKRIETFYNAVRGVEFGFACQIKEPGVIYNAVKGKYILGNLEKVHQGVKSWGDLLNSSGIKAETTNEIEGYLWSKLLINSALNPVSAIKKYSFREIIENKDSRELFKKLYREGYPIVKRKVEELKQKLGNFIGPSAIVNSIFKNEVLSDFILGLVAKKFGEVESSMLQDIRKNKPTEIEFINGEIINLGKKYDINTPLNNWIYEEIKKLEPKSKERIKC